MIPAYEDRWVTIHGGDCREVLRQMLPASVHAVVTSPPYYGLRDYGTGTWEGGDPECDHLGPPKATQAGFNERFFGKPSVVDKQAELREPYGAVCGRCGAIRVEPTVWGGDPEHEHVWGAATGYIGHRGNRGQVPQTKWQSNDTYPQNRHQAQGATSQRSGRSNVDAQRSDNHRALSTQSTCECGAWRGALGLEPTPEMYIEHLVEVMREVRRVLRPEGTVWLNLGDSFASTGGERVYGSSDGGTGRGPGTRRHDVAASGMKPKDLMGIPWLVAFALRADGWWLRRDVIWDKPNGMPESVDDRPTSSHEYLFMLTASRASYYDWFGVREPSTDPEPRRPSQRGFGGKMTAMTDRTTFRAVAPLRRRRDVWRIPTEPYPGAHFATFPRALVEPCVKASTSEHGVCALCLAPWERILEQTATPRNPARPQAQQAVQLARQAGLTQAHFAAIRSVGATDAGKARVTQTGTGRNADDVAALAAEAKAALGGYYREFLLTEPVMVGWRPTCEHVPTAEQPAALIPATVLDPFAGSGTTGLVAQALGRRAVLIDLNPEYLRQAMARSVREWGVGGPILEDPGDVPHPEDSIWRQSDQYATPWDEVVAAYSGDE